MLATLTLIVELNNGIAGIELASAMWNTVESLGLILAFVLISAFGPF